MIRYRALLCWLGGVLTDALADLTLSALDPTIAGHERMLWKGRIDPIATNLVLGKIEPDGFCSEVLRTCPRVGSEKELQERLLARARLRSDVLGVIERIPADYEKWLICDLPPAWFVELIDHPSLAQVFPEDRTLYTAELGLGQLQPQIFQALPEAVGHEAGECLVVDGDSKRAVESIRHGLVSMIYVYPARLAHELALHNIMHGGAEVMHPASSERVELL